MHDTPPEAIIASYLHGVYDAHPYVAIKAGLHAYDGHVADWSSSAITRRIATLKTQIPPLETLATLPLTMSHSGNNAVPQLTMEGLHRWDARLALANARAEQFFWHDWRPFETNPLAYLSLLDISPYIKRSYAPLPERISALTRHVAKIPQIIETMRGHLRPSLSRPIVQQSIATFEGLARFHAGDLVTLAQNVGDASLLHPFQKANRAAIAAYRDIASQLHTMLRVSSDMLSLGESIMRGMLATEELIDLPLAELRAMGEADLALNHARIVEVSAKLGTTPAQAMADLGRSHPPLAEILPRTRQMLEELRQFLIDRAIVSIPSESRCMVQETLPFMRTGSAFMDAPGPFEPNMEAYYYLTLPDPAWPRDQQEAWMAKQSIPGLANTSIHEAWPGHYLQHLHLATAPSDASKLFTCTSFVEGWAHYVEQVMVEQGYHADDPTYELQQLSMALLRDCRFLIALRLHSGESNIHDAAEFITREAFFTPIRAQQEAIRGTRDPAYLNYTLGKLMLLRLREELRHAYPAWSTRTLHDAMLAFGGPPIPLLREVLLRS